MKTVLVLTDFSSLAENAAFYAAKFAQQIHANLLLFNAFGTVDNNNIASQGMIWQNNFAELQQRSDNDLKNLRVKLELEIRNYQPKVDFYPKISIANDFGVMSDLIEELILKNAVGLIVMGGQHINNLSRLFLGSDTHDLLDKIVCPVLIIPKGVTYHKLEKITYATDLKSTDHPLIASIVALGKLFSANISITHIESNPKSVRLAIIQNSELDIHQHIDHKNIHFKVVYGKNMTKALCEESDAEKTDMLVLVHKKYHFLESIFHTSVSKLMAKTCPIPLLVYPFTYYQLPN